VVKEDMTITQVETTQTAPRSQEQLDKAKTYFGTLMKQSDVFRALAWSRIAATGVMEKAYVNGFSCEPYLPTDKDGLRQLGVIVGFGRGKQRRQLDIVLAEGSAEESALRMPESVELEIVQLIRPGTLEEAHAIVNELPLTWNDAWARTCARLGYTAVAEQAAPTLDEELRQLTAPAGE
jgi:hypothetical protein